MKISNFPWKIRSQQPYPESGNSPSVCPTLPLSQAGGLTQGQRGRQFRSHAALGDELGP